MSFEPLGLPYKHQSFEGIPLTGFITPERLEEIRDRHESRPDDVFIATFLKCGTNEYLYFKLIKDRSNNI